MRRFPLLAVCLCATLYSGCATVTSYAKLEPQLEQWQQEDEYGYALDALERIGPKDPDYPKASQLRKQFEKMAAEYEQRVRKETDRLQKKGDWAAALDQYDVALAKYPKSAVIKDGLAKLHQVQRKTVDSLEFKRLIQHGEWLRNTIPVYRDISRVDPRSSAAQKRLEAIQLEAAKVAKELVVIGNKALANDDLNLADATLPLAYDLHDDPVIEESLATLREIQQRLAQAQREERRKREQRTRAREEKRKREIDNLEKAYRQAFDKRDYLTAGEKLKRLAALDKNHAKLPAMQNNLKAAIDKQVTQLFERGVSAYSRGQFEKAADYWRQALRLAPDHQPARESLDRAEKVLEKIRSLKQKQGD